MVEELTGRMDRDIFPRGKATRGKQVGDIVPAIFVYRNNRKGRFINFPALISPLHHGNEPSFHKFQRRGGAVERSFRAVVISFTSKARSSANCAKSMHGKKTGRGRRE